MASNEALNQFGYSDTSINANKGAAGLRERPGTLLEDGSYAGCVQAIFEIIANSVDEARQGFGKNVEVIVNDDNSATIIDHGRGVPMGWNSKENKFNWELVFCTLYASGKGKGTAYSTSEGLNGVGCTAAQYTSDYMDVFVNRVNDQGVMKYYEMHFKKGEPVGSLIERDADKGATTGTRITVRPDPAVFRITDIKFETYADRIRRKAMTVPGIAITLTYKGGEPNTFLFEKGMQEYIENNTEGKRVADEVMDYELKKTCNDLMIDTGNYLPEKDYQGEVTVAITFVKDEGTIEVYHNGAILSDGGPTKDAITDAVTKMLTKYARDTDKIPKTERFLTRDIEDMIFACAETRCPSGFSDYAHQSKTSIRNPSLIKLTSDAVTQCLNKWSLKNKKSFESIVKEAVANKTSREKAEQFKKSELRKLTQDINKIGNEPEKLLPAKCKDPKKCEIFIIEGDSAKGAVSSSRDGEYQAVFPLRGKIPNCLKKTLETLIKSEIILNLLAILGCGVEKRTKYMKDIPAFDVNKLNYHKIILTTDADVDGGHINCLLLVFLLVFVPSLIKLGYVYLAVSPLFFISVSDRKEKYYGYTEKDRDRIVDELIASGVPESKISVQRSKGLGENSEEDMYNTVLNPKTRKLIQVQYPDDDQSMWELCNQLLGTDIDSRREIIKEYFNTVQAVEE